MTAKAERKPIPTLVEFIKAKKRENCRVCKLPIQVRSQLGKPASEKKISRDEQIAWVEVATGVKITHEELTQHITGRHDV